MTESPILYSVQPLNFSSSMQVSSCFCTCRGRMLLLRSAPHKPFGSTWSAPGGKLDQGETPLETAIRETFEETAIVLDPQKVHSFQTFYVRYPSLDFLYHIFYTSLAEMPQEISLQAREHDAYVWALPEELSSLPLMPGAYEAFQHLYGDPLKF